MESLRRSMRYQFIESKKFMLGFWVTMIIVNILFYSLNSIDAININIGLSIEALDGIGPMSVAGINLLAILISLLVYNYASNYENFPLAISLSMTRKDYFFSFLIDNIIIAFIFATIQGVLLKLDPFFVKLISRAPLYDFMYFNTKTDHVFYIIFILFIAFLGFISFWNLIATINYKFGYKMWLVYIGVNILISALNIGFITKTKDFIRKIFDSKLGVFQIFIMLISIVGFYSINYYLVTRTNIKKKIS